MTNRYRQPPQIIYTMPYTDRLMGLVVIGVFVALGLIFGATFALVTLANLFGLSK